MIRSAFLRALVLLLSAASALPAQLAPHPLGAPSTARFDIANARMTSVPTPGETSVGRPVLGSLLGGAAGVLVGSVAGLFIGGNRCSTPGNGDTCQGIEGMFLGGELGLTLGAPIGAHLVNRRQGSLPLSMLTSVALAGAGVAAVVSADRLQSNQRNNVAQVSFAVAVPVLQLVSAAIIERVTSRP